MGAFALACASETPKSGETQNGAEALSADGQTLAARSDAPQTTTVEAPAKVTVLFFGTSLTAGLGLDPGDAFPNMVARTAAASSLPITAINAGLSGETSAGALRRIEWTLGRGPPVDIIVLETGGNDALRALDADSLAANLSGIVSRIRKAQPSARIILAVMEAPPNLGARYTSRFREAYAEVARREKLTLLPFLLDGVAGRADLNQADGVHPNMQGERIVAENVWRALRPVVEEVYAIRSRG